MISSLLESDRMSILRTRTEGSEGSESFSTPVTMGYHGSSVRRMTMAKGKFGRLGGRALPWKQHLTVYQNVIHISLRSSLCS